MAIFRRWRGAAIRLAGLGAVAVAVAAGHFLRVVEHGHPHPLPAIGYALAAVAFLGGSLGAALGLWGAGLRRVMPAPGLWIARDPSSPADPADSPFPGPGDHGPQAP